MQEAQWGSSRHRAASAGAAAQPLPPDWQEQARLQGLTDFVAVPIWRGDTIIGALQVGCRLACRRALPAAAVALALAAAGRLACGPASCQARLGLALRAIPLCIPELWKPSPRGCGGAR